MFTAKDDTSCWRQVYGLGVEDVAGVVSESVVSVISKTTPASLQSFKIQREHTAFVEPVKIRTEQAVLDDAVFLEF